MYLSDLIRDSINSKLKETCINKTITCTNIESNKEETFKCANVKFDDDDGNCWITFWDEKGNNYIVDGQGIDIYFEIK